MLRDELELITGQLISGSLTPTIYKLLKDSPYLTSICDRLGITRRTENADSLSTSDARGEDFGSGFDILRWLASADEFVPIQRQDADSTGPVSHKSGDD